MQQATPIGHRARSAARFAPSCSRDVAHESRSAEAEALAWARVHGGGGATRGREGRHAEGTREAEEAARASGTGRRGAWHLQRVHDRLGARSSAMTKATMMRGVLVPAACPRLPSRKTSSSGYMVPGANLGLEHAQTANHMVRGFLRRLLLTAHRLPTHGRRLLAILQRMDSRLNRRRA